MALFGAISSAGQVDVVADTTGTLTVLRGGTGVTTSTGTGSTVLSAAPTFTGLITAAIIVLSGGLRLANAAATIATGAITAASPHITVDTEAAAASDDLDTISGGTIGDVVILKATASARDVVVRHLGGGTGNIRLGAGKNFTLGDVDDYLMLRFDGTNWHGLGRKLVAPPTYSASNVTPDRSYDASATTLTEVANVLGTLIDDLRVQHGLLV